MDNLYIETLDKIKSKILNEIIGISINETTDVDGRFIAKCKHFGNR